MSHTSLLLQEFFNSFKEMMNSIKEVVCKCQFDKDCIDFKYGRGFYCERTNPIWQCNFASQLLGCTFALHAQSI